MAGFLFDLDGTIYRGNEMIEGALDTYNWLIEKGHSVVFVTNKPIQSQEEYHAKLTKMGFRLEVNQVVNSCYATAIYLQRSGNEGDRHYVIGEQPLKDELSQAGLVMTEDWREAQTVVLSWDRQFTYDKLNRLYQAWNNGARIVATNPDVTCPVDGGEVPDCGTLIAAIEAATKEPITEIGGKPSKLMADLVLSELLKLPADQCYMIGDRLETDILMGNRAGIPTVLVMSGVTTPEMAAQSDIKPWITLPSVKELPAFLTNER